MKKYKLIIWDFDGVIIFSDPIRKQGFREVLNEFPKDKVDKLLLYHEQNGGLSRYVKFRYFFERILQKEVSDDKINQLAAQFSDIMRRLLTNKDLLNPEWLSLMQHLNKDIEHHIASGSDGKELQELCTKLDIAHYFKTINGSPTPKTELVNQIIKSSNITQQDIVLIGDAINDFEAAKDNGIGFLGYNNEGLKELSSYLRNLNELIK